MALFDELNAASFRGVSFLLDSNELASGRKIVVHEYPNKSQRFVEDLGGLLRTFRIKGTISEPSYRIKRDALITALETPGIGTLVHPLYGTVQVTPEPYTLYESMQRLGEASFEMVFLESVQNIFPIQSSNNQGLINQLSQAGFTLIQSSMVSKWNVNNRYKINYINAQQILGSLADFFKAVPAPFSSVPYNVSLSEQQLDLFTRNISALIPNATSLAANINSLFSLLDALSPLAIERFTTATNFFKYGQKIVFPKITTVSRQQLVDNNLALYSQVNFTSLVNAYNAAAQITYTDEQDINTTEAVLDEQYYYALDVSNFDDATLDAIKTLRNQIRDFFDQNRINIRKLVTITTNQTTITVLTYSYYNNLDNDLLIMDINGIDIPNNIKGVLQIVTNQ